MTSLNIKNMDSAVADRFRHSARIRGIGQAEMLKRLVSLHESLIQVRLADEVPPMDTLLYCGLEPVREGESDA